MKESKPYTLEEFDCNGTSLVPLCHWRLRATVIAVEKLQAELEKVTQERNALLKTRAL